MKIISIIPARGGSKEIPLKNLTFLKNKPLLYYTVKASLNSKIVDRTIVSTDNENIEKTALKLGAEVIKRPKKLSGNKIGIEPSIDHVLKVLKKTESYVPDFIILLQNTSPLRTSYHIDEAWEFFKKGKFDSVLSGYRNHSLLWKIKRKNVTPVNYNFKNRLNRQHMKEQFIENGAMYITKYSLFKKNLCRISGKIGMYEMPDYLSIQIDSKFDVLLANDIFKNLKSLLK